MTTTSIIGRRIPWLGIALNAALASPAMAQGRNTALEKDRPGTVRISGPVLRDGRLKGWLVRWSADSLTIAGPSGTVQLARTGITRIEVSRGRNRLLWGVLGGVVGEVAAGLKIAVAPTRDYGDLAVALLAPVIGSVIGFITAPERWRAIPLGASRLAIRGVDGRIGVGFTVAL